MLLWVLRSTDRDLLSAVVDAGMADFKFYRDGAVNARRAAG